MQVTVNGRPHTLPDMATVSDLTLLLNAQGRIAIEINREIAPRSQWTHRVLQEGDAVEIVRAIGGG